MGDFIESPLFSFVELFEDEFLLVVWEFVHVLFESMDSFTNNNILLHDFFTDGGIFEFFEEFSGVNGVVVVLLVKIVAFKFFFIGFILDLFLTELDGGGHLDEEGAVTGAAGGGHVGGEGLLGGVKVLFEEGVVGGLIGLGRVGMLKDLWLGEDLLVVSGEESEVFEGVFHGIGCDSERCVEIFECGVWVEDLGEDGLEGLFGLMGFLVGLE